MNGWRAWIAVLLYWLASNVYADVFVPPIWSCVSHFVRSRRSALRRYMEGSGTR